MVSTEEPLHLYYYIDNNIDVSIEVKIYSETLLRLRNKDLRHAFRFSKKYCANCIRVCVHLVYIICDEIFIEVHFFLLSHVKYTQIVYSKDMMGSWYCEQNT